MIGAATAFIGRNSGHIVTINLCENDSRVYLVKGTEPKPINEIPVSSYTLSSEVLPSGKTYKWKSE
jgi:hypothetical protein